MEDTFRELAGTSALLIEAAAVVIISLGALEALLRALLRIVPGVHGVMRRKEVWVRFAVWLMLGLELELGADLVRTAISPTWTAIGQLAAIAAIRTVLNYFLEKDIAEFAAESGLSADAHVGDGRHDLEAVHTGA